MIQALQKEGWDIDVLSARHDLSTERYERVNSTSIYRLDNYHNIICNTMSRLSNVSLPRLTRLMHKISSFLLRAANHLRFKRRRFRYEIECAGWEIESLIDKINKLNGENAYDFIFSVSYPFYNHIVVKEYFAKYGKHMPWIVYETDPFAYNTPSYGEDAIEKYAKEEEEVFETADIVLLTPELFQYYKRTQYQAFYNKFVSFPFPNMKEIVVDDAKAKDIHLAGEKRMLFTGAIYPEIRSPKYLFDCLGRLPDDYFLTIVGNDKSKEILDSACNAKNKYEIYPRQNLDTALSLIMKADFLVNIGNTVAFQTPGKVFEYIASGKPIIHFSKMQEDPSPHYLKNYPMALIIPEYEGNMEDHVHAIEKFCKTYKGQQMPYSEVLEYLPELESNTVTSKFIAIVNEILKV